MPGFLANLRKIQQNSSKSYKCLFFKGFICFPKNKCRTQLLYQKIFFADIFGQLATWIQNTAISTIYQLLAALEIECLLFIGAGAAYRSWNPRQKLEAGSNYSSLPEQAGQKREPTDGGGAGPKPKLPPPSLSPILSLKPSASRTACGSDPYTCLQGASPLGLFVHTPTLQNPEGKEEPPPLHRSTWLVG